jgi:hypothetical protein
LVYSNGRTSRGAKDTPHQKDGARTMGASLKEKTSPADTREAGEKTPQKGFSADRNYTPSPNPSER